MEVSGRTILMPACCVHTDGTMPPPRQSNKLGTAGVFSYRPAHAHRNDPAIEIAFAGKEAPADFRVVGRSVRRARHGAGTRKRTWRAARKVSGEPGDRAELE